MSRREDGSTAFDAIVDSLDPPMYVVTAADGNVLGGCLVGFASQCGIDPLRFMVWISKENHTYEVVQKASVITVHALRATNVDVAQHFGELTGDTVDKFEGLDWVEGSAGNPVLEDLDWFAGTVLQRVDCGDHPRIAPRSDRRRM